MRNLTFSLFESIILLREMIAIALEVLLRTMLYQIEKAKSLEEAISAIRVMCSKDDIAAVEQELKKYQEQNNQG